MKFVIGSFLTYFLTFLFTYFLNNLFSNFQILDYAKRQAERAHWHIGTLSHYHINTSTHHFFLPGYTSNAF